MSPHRFVTRHRYRIASLSCFPTYACYLLNLENIPLILTSASLRFNFSIDGHSMTVIETDGVETQPYTVDTITVEPGK